MSEKFSTLAAKWLYGHPLLTINERSVVARFAQWLDERTGDETPALWGFRNEYAAEDRAFHAAIADETAACGCYTITNHLGESRTNFCYKHVSKAFEVPR